MPKSRIFNVMQYERHPETGELLLTEDKIKTALAHRTIRRWAYICHDQDVYSALDEEQDPSHKEGDEKPRHWHIVIEMGTNAAEVSTIAKWLGIADNFVNCARGAGAFLDCCKYLTHEDIKQQGILGKRLYLDDCVRANFAFRDELDHRAARQAKYGRDLSEKDMLRNEVMYGGMTLKKVRENYPIAYQNDFTILDKCRQKYLQNQAKLPPMRVNYYIEGPGGIGKNTASRAIACANFPDLDEDEVYFEVGGTKVNFEGYDGQPVIIWNDQRSDKMVDQYGIGELMDIFDTHPTGARHNVKYGSVRLCNCINIVNGVQPYLQFMDGLVGITHQPNEIVYPGEVDQSVEDRMQAYRRFPLIILLRESDFDLLMNKGMAYGTRAYDQYIQYRQIRGSFANIARKLEGAARKKVEVQMLGQVLECTKSLQAQSESKISEVTEIPDEFSSYGTVHNDNNKVCDDIRSTYLGTTADGIEISYSIDEIEENNIPF